ncbi:aminoglycoside phosphotransferase family protein [Paenibacillus chibensis]|uniref:Aminoglycoside phosphotransferase family protein n=1 Tax=Paenibacillus chibensis TaxID=59846 RepID=A0ABU6PPB7_9BACL|nr:aminoglycoside phosphotransferase family protein [Paenibacillus chibensis]
MTDAYIRRIQDVYPELSIDEVEPNDIGQNNDVLIVNQSIVFRFPKHVQGVEKLKRETQLLKFIRPSVTLPVPDPMYHAFTEMEVGRAFMGYPLIEGSPFWKEAYVQMKEQDNEDAIALQLVTFLNELHSMDMPPTAGVIKPGKDVIQMMKELLLNIQNKLFPYMRVEAQRQVTDNFSRFLHDPSNQSLKMTLIHGDFGAGNIIWHAEKSRIAGIIDFGGSGFGDPAYDFAGILSSYGQDFFEKCIGLYPGGRQIAERVHFYRSTFALQEALHGMVHHDEEAFENGIREFR